MLPRLAQTTTPRPMASGPPQLRNLSLGAQAATVDRPPTMPAVYQAARVRIGPPVTQAAFTFISIMSANYVRHFFIVPLNYENYENW
jgi:hypothetical protein